MLMWGRLWMGQHPRFQGFATSFFFFPRIALWFRKLIWICASLSTPLLNWTHVREKNLEQSPYSPQGSEESLKYSWVPVYFTLHLFYTFFVSRLFLLFPTILSYLLLFPVPFLCFIICSKQAVKVMMPENVKLFKSMPSKWFQPNADVCARLLCHLWPLRCNTTGSMVYWTLPSLCPRNVASECKLWFRVTVWLWAKHRAEFPVFSNVVCIGSWQLSWRRGNVSSLKWNTFSSYR